MRPVSIQQVTCTYSTGGGAGGMTADQAITAVGSTSRSEVFHLGENVGIENPGPQAANLSMVSLTSTSNARATRTASTATTGNPIGGAVNVQVTEWPA